MVGGKIKAEGFFEPTAERRHWQWTADAWQQKTSHVPPREMICQLSCALFQVHRVPFCSRRVGGTSEGTSMLGWGNEKSPTAMY